MSASDVPAFVEPAVCIDFVNPKAYLALAPTFALEDELGVHFDWLPMRVSAPTRPAAAQPNEDRGTRHRRMRAEYNDMDMRRYARVYGIELGDPYRSEDPTIAAIGLAWARRAPHAARRRYVQGVFERFWGGRLDIEDPAAMEAVLREAAVDTTGWRDYVADAGRVEFERTCAALRGRGVFDVPAYLVDGDLFFGRQHLPMIRWLLDGKRGEAPL